MSRGISDISGLQNIRTMHSAGKRSIPKVASSAYLDSYMLGKEEERLEKENAVLQKRKAAIQRRLKEIEREKEEKKKTLEGLLFKQEKEQQVGPKEVTNEESQGKRWKKMSLSY
jgi:hypothetical protein